MQQRKYESWRLPAAQDAGTVDAQKHSFLFWQLPSQESATLLGACLLLLL